MDASTRTMSAVSILSSLVELNLEGCAMDDEGLKIFIDNFPSSGGSTGSLLRRLNLSNNKLSPDGIHFLAQSLLAVSPLAGVYFKHEISTPVGPFSPGPACRDN